MSLPRSATTPHQGRWPRLWPIASAAVLVIACGYALGWALVPGIGTDDPLQYDLAIYRAAIGESAAGHSLYDYATGEGDVFNYPPFAALILWPLHWLGDRAAALGWTALTLAAAIWTVVLLYRAAQRHHQQRNFPLFAIALSLVLVSSAHLSTQLWGQLGALLTVLVLIDALGRLPRPFGGALVGLAAAVKLAPLMFIPYFLLTRRYREAATASAVFAGAALLAWGVFPSDSARFWLSETFRMRERVWDIGDPANQSLYSFVLRCGLGPTATSLVFAASALAVLAVWAVWTRRLRTRDPVLAVLVTGCVWLLLEPVTWVHHLYWPVLAGAWLVLRYRDLPRRGAGVAVMLLMLRPMDWGDRVPDQNGLWQMLSVNSWLLVVMVTVTVLPALVAFGGTSHGKGSSEIEAIRQLA
ncbi:glycosyltransferase family 87 protein [Streptomyces sp. CB02923]|uniref:glycosyltransferase family 87 protein n=1 Tax=Streptomyces sp. CB02923 TaxID=1718985 RepID=UPI0019017149|nr:glycosyltransferase family 87 protein [Streptomyces sp. CB02923]